ncbi:hypothetical protein [Deinococcus sp. Leaf326]|uniref:hypothetical protein n=1 Tax=Deinococcus sp. Leaf326 TaxID=1736338 RepID=UPI0006F821F8|nr:hypothetical protein [Deinococcus sp. Leaf326]KQR22857.1 hypothetical protein ASF71_06740 [Deinococcus sp. Leaf326]
MSSPDLTDILALLMTLGFFAGAGSLCVQTYLLFRDMQPPHAARWTLTGIVFVGFLIYLATVAGDYPSVMAALTNQEQDASWGTVWRGFSGALILWAAVAVLHTAYRHILLLQGRLAVRL